MRLHCLNFAVQYTYKVNNNFSNLLIDFRYGNKQLKMSELSSIPATLSEDNPNIKVIWGMTSDETLIDSYKVTLLASVKA